MNSEQVFHTKQSLLLEGLAEGLFGHIMVTSTFWDRVGQHLEEYLALCERRNSVKQGLEQLNSVIFHHHLSKFPVSKVHLKEVIEWVQNNLQILGHQLTLPIDAKELLATDNLLEPKYIFKSLRRNLHREDTIVTLLEENEIIGNGTTGLTSWQGNVEHPYLDFTFILGSLLIDGHSMQMCNRLLLFINRRPLLDRLVSW